MPTIAERLSELITHLGGNQSDFARRTRTDRRNISNAVAGKTIPSTDLLSNIIDNIPELNARWLFTGEGPMLTKDIPAEADSVQEEPQAAYKTKAAQQRVNLDNIRSLDGCKELALILQERNALLTEKNALLEERNKNLQEKLDAVESK